MGAVIEQVGHIRIVDDGDDVCVWWPGWIIVSGEGGEGSLGVEYKREGGLNVGRGCKVMLGIDGALSGDRPHLRLSPAGGLTARERLASVRVGVAVDGSGGYTVDDLVRIAG